MGRQETASSVPKMEELSDKEPNKLDDLIKSHDELEIVCQTMMEIILRARLGAKLSKCLYAKKVSPGFAERSEQVKEKFKHERRMLMASGVIQ